jgi:hypothetical protein
VRVRAALDVVCGLAAWILAAVLWQAGRLIVVAALGAARNGPGGWRPSAEQIAGLQTRWTSASTHRDGHDGGAYG